MDLGIAASACASSRFENMTSAKEFRNLERTRFIEYCESSHRAMTLSVDLYISFVMNSLVFLLIGLEIHVRELLQNWASVVLANSVGVLAHGFPDQSKETRENS